MTIDDQIRDEKLQHDIKYEYLTGKEMLPSNQEQIIEQVKFAYSPLGEAFQKQIKTMADEEKKIS